MVITRNPTGVYEREKMGIEKEPVQTIPIDFNERYVVLVTLPEGMSPDQANRNLASLRDDLDRWKKSDETFFIYGVYEGVSVKFERIDNDS